MEECCKGETREIKCCMGRGANRVTSPLSSPSLPLLLTLLVFPVWGRVRGQCQDVRGSSVETFRERGERDAEIEACLHTGNPINQHVNTSPFPPLSASSFKTISESSGTAHKGGNKFRWQPLRVVFTFNGGLAMFCHQMIPQIPTHMTS